MAPPESSTRSCRRTFSGVTIYHRIALQRRSQTMRWFMPERTLYTAIVFLVGLAVTGVPAYGTDSAPPPAALQNAEPSGSPQGAVRKSFNLCAVEKIPDTLPMQPAGPPGSPGEPMCDVWILAPFVFST